MDNQELKTEMAEEISQMSREYRENGLSQEEIADVLQWQAELASSRTTTGVESEDLIEQNK